MTKEYNKQAKNEYKAMHDWVGKRLKPEAWGDLQTPVKDHQLMLVWKTRNSKMQV